MANTYEACPGCGVRKRRDTRRPGAVCKACYRSAKAPGSVVRTEGAAPEEWRPVPGFEGDYEVSSYGNVRALTYRNGTGLHVLPEPKPVAQSLSHRGYMDVRLWRASVASHRLVHRLVLEAFVGPAPEGHEAAHLDGVRTNNQPGNLAWTSRPENHWHKEAHGTAQKGARNPTAKLTEEQARAVIVAWKRGDQSKVAIARTLGVSVNSVYQITSGTGWKHLPR